MKLQLAISRAVALTFFALATFVSTNASGAPAKHTFAIGTNDFLLDGQRFQIRCGEMHAARMPAEYWRQRLRMAKAMGTNTIAAYYAPD